MALNNRKPLKEEIFEELRRRIIAGQYAPGDWLRQEEIAAQMGVSMTPTREALDLLVASGMAEKVPYRGVRVRLMDARDVAEAYGMRLALEAVVARAAAKRISRAQIAELEAMLDDMRERHSLSDMPRVRELSREFHLRIAEAAGDNLLTKMYHMVSNAFPDWLMYEAIFRKPELLEESISDMNAEHAAILAALKRKDGEQAARKSIRHLKESGKWLSKYMNVPAELLREKEETVSFLL